MASRDEIRGQIQKIFQQECEQKIPELQDGLALAAELGMDSMAMVGLLMQVEKQYQIKLTFDEVADIVTAGDLLDLVQGKLGAERTTPQISAAVGLV